MGIQVYLIMFTSFKDHMKVIWMVPQLTRMGRQIIQVWLDNILDIVKGKNHCSMEGSSDIFQTEGHFLVRKVPLRIDEGHFMLVFWLNLNLIILKKIIHKRKDFTTRTSINNLVDEWCGVVILQTCLV